MAKNFGSEFGLAVVNAGQRQVNDKAELVVNSTKGGFTLSAAGSSILGVAHGDYIQFVSNYENINNEIKANSEKYKNFCEEHGLTFGTEEATNAIHKEFDVFGIMKGIQMLDKVGQPVMTNERLTQEDRIAYAKANLKAMEDAAMNSGKEEIVEAITREGITDDEKAEILAQFVIIETEKYSGSKLASSSKAMGTGVPLKFSDGNVWNQLKRDINEDERCNINRTYAIDVENAGSMTLNNGYKDIEVPCYLLKFVEDAAPMQRGK